MAKTRKTASHTSQRALMASTPTVITDQLLGDVRALIEAAREQPARAVNSALVGLYWHIGTRIRRDILQEKRAGQGEQTSIGSARTSLLSMGVDSRGAACSG